MITKKRNLDGILLLDKPKGLTSNQALSIAKRLFGAKKAGHTGSLDPLATGLLPICFGEATKFSQFLLESDKHYRVMIKLGIRTDSGDSEGAVIEQKNVSKPFTQAEIESAVYRFKGDGFQIPPMFSAIKHQGQPLYKLARMGVEIERTPRPITIYDLKILSYELDELELWVHASKGTYIRTLADDIGQALNCGAHVIALRRIGIGSFDESQMVTFETLQDTLEYDGMEGLDKHLLSMESALSDWPFVKLSESAAYYLKKGQPVIVPFSPKEGWVKLLLQDDSFVGVGEILDDGRVAPRRLIVSFCE